MVKIINNIEQIQNSCFLHPPWGTCENFPVNTVISDDSRGEVILEGNTLPYHLTA